MPSIMVNKDGRLEAFVIGANKAIWHRWQVQPNGEAWSDWSSLGGDNMAIAVACNKDGRLEVFGLRSDFGIWHIWQISPGGAWSDWSNLGGSYTAISVDRNTDGRLELFALRNDKKVLHCWQTSAGGGWSDWSDLSDVYTFRQIAAIANQDGSLGLFGLTDDNGWILYRPQATPGGSWNIWDTADAGEGDEPTFQTFSVTRNKDGRLELFGLNTAYGIWHTWQVTPNWTDWSGYDNLGGSYTALAAGLDDTGCINIVAVNKVDNLYYTRHQTSPGGGWTSWTLMSPVSVDPLPSGFNSGLATSPPQVHVRSRRADLAGPPNPNVAIVQNLWNDAVTAMFTCGTTFIGSILGLSSNDPGAATGGFLSLIGSQAACAQMNADLDKINDILASDPTLHIDQPAPDNNSPQSIQGLDGCLPDDDDDDDIE